MIWATPIHKIASIEARLAKPGNFSPGILKLLRSVNAIKRREVGLYLAVSDEELARVLVTWAPFIDTAYCISAYRISDFPSLDEYIAFYERTVRKIVTYTDLLLVSGLHSNMRLEDAQFVRHLFETRARKGKPTVVDVKLPKSVWADQYDEIIAVR